MKFFAAVVGSRSFKDYKFLQEKLDLLLRDADKDELVIISGEATGADKLAKKYAEDRGIDYTGYPADWGNTRGKPGHEIGFHSNRRPYWKLAGFARNTVIAKKCDIVIAFWDGKSPGTANIVKEARRLDKPVELIAV